MVSLSNHMPLAAITAVFGQKAKKPGFSVCPTQNDTAGVCALLYYSVKLCQWPFLWTPGSVCHNGTLQLCTFPPPVPPSIIPRILVMFAYSIHTSIQVFPSVIRIRARLVLEKIQMVRLSNENHSSPPPVARQQGARRGSFSDWLIRSYPLWASRQQRRSL